jgi:hypothetical protein
LTSLWHLDPNFSPNLILQRILPKSAQFRRNSSSSQNGSLLYSYDKIEHARIAAIQILSANSNETDPPLFVAAGTTGPTNNWGESVVSRSAPAWNRDESLSVSLGWFLG